MKFGELWLRELVNPPVNTNTLVDQLTMAGLEVISIEPIISCFSGVVTGKITECYQHPKNSKLYITKVDIGNKQTLNIACSATNCRVNLKVAVATLGATISGNLKIKATEQDGESSEGMLCSLSELGITGGPKGIIILPDEAPIGHDIHDHLQLNDNTITIKVTPNRADCLSLLGIARDIAIRNHLPLNLPIIKTVASTINDALKIHINAIDACPRYLSRIVKNIDVSAITPLWITNKLLRCNIQSVNTVVDITNYVMLELGQPIHVFDRNHIKGEIIVRYAKHNETITLFNDNKIMLSPNTLIITDHDKILSIAGVISSTEYGINPNTHSIVLECAFFNPLTIISQASYYGINTEASLRYERGVDPKLQPIAMERVTELILMVCGGQAGPVINITSTTSTLKQFPTINLRRKVVDRLIGYFIPDKDIKYILNSIGCQVKRTIEGWQAIAPSWRFDIAIEEDLIEEIIRIYGYEAIPNIPVHANLIIPHHREAMIPITRIKTLLVNLGYQEAITYSFVNPHKQELLYPKQVPLVLPNPISQDMSVMRLSLWTGLISVVIYNQNRQQQRIRLFESGLCFIPDKTAPLGIRQELMLAGIITGPKFNEHWDQKYQLVDFYDLKGDLETILETTRKLNNVDFIAQEHPALHPGQSAAIYLNNEIIGFIGVIHPVLEMKLNLNNRTIVFELFWEKIATSTVPEVNNVSRFPTNRRDISIIVNDNVNAVDILKECKKIKTNQLIDVNLFDVYRGNGVKDGYKSLTISLILQDTTHTLEEDEITIIVAECVTALKQRFKASLRN